MQDITKTVLEKTESTLMLEKFSEIPKGGVIMDVTTPEEAKIAEDAGAIAVMALQAVPAKIREEGGIARMANSRIVKDILDTVDIPVMAKCRIGHFAEAQVLEELGADMVDESEVLTPADKSFHVDKKKLEVPFVCGSTDLGSALRRIEEGAAMIRTKGEAGTGNIAEAVKHMRGTNAEIRNLEGLSEKELKEKAKEYGVSVNLVKDVSNLGRLPVVWYCAGGIATPADAALAMQLGVDGVFVGSGIFESENPPKMAESIVKAAENFNESDELLDASMDLPKAMKGSNE